MEFRSSKFWVVLFASAVVWATLVGAGAVQAANTPPVADSWNITSSGKARSSGELRFRLSDQANDDSIEITVFVLSGTNETGVASSIRRALSTQLDAQRFDVEAGEGANVQLSSDRSNGFSLELVDSDVDDVRVVVSSATPVPPPTVPPQQSPANSPAIPSTPPAPGDASPPPAPGPANSSAPPATVPPPQSDPPAPGESLPGSGEGGGPASAPPPPPVD
ncbi:MAG: hypothetical protein K0Q92_3228 [Steroidobacteraceae bacterium]|jgi:hypothetical protein|nr:hypothetical protein [Steroidobacteraceae bacterium]